MKTKIYIGAKVAKNAQKGEIINIITKSTGYVEVRWENGKTSKEMAFNLTDENGEALKSKPVAKAIVDTRTPQQRMADELVALANVSCKYNRSYCDIAANQLGSFIAKMRNVAGFASQIAATVDKSLNAYGSQVAYISAKQAWVLANAAIENGINL